MRVSLSVKKKAFSLVPHVVRNQDGSFTVPSTSRAGATYIVSIDEKQPSCNCQAITPCSHRLAVKWYREQMLINKHNTLRKAV